MLETQHNRYECKHGTLISQCRCLARRTVVIADCPEHCPKKNEKE